MSTLAQLRAVQSANRFQTPQGKEDSANDFGKSRQSPQKASTLFPGANSASTNAAHWKKGALSIIRGQSPMLYDRIKILTSKQLSDDVAIKIYDDDNYILQSLTLDEEQKLGKLELDNKMNENRRKRDLNSILSEQRVQGAHQILKYVSTESKALID